MSNDLTAELAQRYTSRQLAMDARGYVVKRIGRYEIIEGIGPDGGYWIARGRGESARFRSRAEAEEHAQLSSDESPFPDAAKKEGKKLSPPTADAEEDSMGRARRIMDMEQALAQMKRRLGEPLGTSERRDLQQDIQRLQFQLAERKREHAKDQDMLVGKPAEDANWKKVGRVGDYDILREVGLVDHPAYRTRGDDGEVREFAFQMDAENYAKRRAEGKRAPSTARRKDGKSSS